MDMLIMLVVFIGSMILIGVLIGALIALAKMPFTVLRIENHLINVGKLMETEAAARLAEQQKTNRLLQDLRDGIMAGNGRTPD